MKNPCNSIEEVRQETSKVTWPTWKEVWITTVMVADHGRIDIDVLPARRRGDFQGH
jgi:hypothetical protein